MLTDEEIRSLLTLDVLATKAPWKGFDERVFRTIGSNYKSDVVSTSVSGMEGGGVESADDMRLIVEARNNLRALCEEVLRLRDADRNLKTVIIAAQVVVADLRAEIEWLRNNDAN